MTTTAGITYHNPTATLLHAPPLINAEIAGRTAYKSFQASEHESVRLFDGTPVQEDIDSSKLLHDLCHVYFHESVIEHVNLTYHLTTSRGVLQELARHRIASYTVQSTRYTMSDVLYAYLASKFIKGDPIPWFIDKLQSFGVFMVTSDAELMEIKQLFLKLDMQEACLEEDVVSFAEICLSKSNLELFQSFTDESPDIIFEALKSGKQKRNVGDNFKWIVTDNWKVDLVMTANLRSLKNFFQLRDSGAAYFQIRELAQTMKAVTPSKYLDLIVKK